MKRTETRQMVIGGVAMTVLVVLVFLSYLDNRQDRLRSDSYRVDALFNRVDGLSVGAPVLLSGINIGTVHGMALEGERRVRVILAIRRDVALPADTSAAIHTDGLFGSKFVIMEPGGAEADLADGDTITFTQDSLIVSELLELIISEGQAARARAEDDDGDAPAVAPALP
ncbi:MAG: MCE family protein [Rhodospirillales bacterium]|nr:MAG: MCE family protein [Rhodospirillales bacterium]